jgi:hypothetical protein
MMFKIWSKSRLLEETGFFWGLSSISELNHTLVIRVKDYRGGPADGSPPATTFGLNRPPHRLWALRFFFLRRTGFRGASVRRMLPAESFTTTCEAGERVKSLSLGVAV